jgi:hypothetical protein
VDQTWSDLGLPYVMADDLTVTAHTTLAAGVQVQFPASTWLHVGNVGSLTANAVVSNRILLTGTTKTPGFWRGVRFLGSNSVNNSLQYVTIEYGGGSYASVTADLYVDAASRLDMQHCTIQHSSGYGIGYKVNVNFTESNTTYANNTLSNTHQY